MGGKSPTKRPLYRNQEEAVNTTAYHEYPTKPFINDDYRFDPAKPTKPFPENNRTGMSAVVVYTVKAKIEHLYNPFPNVIPHLFSFPYDILF